MKALIISNMHPSGQKPYAGIFVKNQLEHLRHAYPEASFDIYAMPRKITGAVGSVVKYIKAFLFFFTFLHEKI